MPDQTDQTDRKMTRRQALGAGAGAFVALAAGGYGVSRASSGAAKPAADVVLRAQPATVELGARRAATWTYDGQLPGREVRLRQGQPVRIRVDNALDEATSIHWHGIRLRNEADGVPGFTQDAVKPGDSYLYEFTPPDAGTYFLHSHVGTQLDRGLYAPLIVEARNEQLDYDTEHTVILDDWLDGVAGTPDKALAALKRSGMSMSMAPVPASALRGPHTTLSGAVPGAGDLAGLANAQAAGKVDAGDVQYPLYLVNGRPADAPAQLDVRRGQRVRLRLINAAADTTFTVFADGLPMTVTHADGLPVEHVETDALLMGMGERYDVLVDIADTSSRRLLAMPSGKRGQAMAILRPAGAASAAPAAAAPFATPRRLASYTDLRSPSAPTVSAAPRITRLDLAMKGAYGWTLGGQLYESADVVELRRGEAQRLVMRNLTGMAHPMHLHGHSFRVAGTSVVKDTVMVLPQQQVAVDFIADNPGDWAFHCHNVFHMEAGMMRRVRVS